jgi:hypothetical protein
VASCAGLGWLGCAGRGPGPPPPKPEPPAERDRVVAQLTDLLTAVRLDWLVMLRPRDVVALPWLQPTLARILKDDRLDLLAANTGVDLRQAAEIALAGYAPGPAETGETVAYFVRHRSEPIDVERKFRARLTGGEERSVSGHQLVRVSGTIGTRFHGFVSVGRDVAGFQYGGSPRKGPARIAELYAMGKLASVPTALAEPSLALMHRALEGALAEVLLPGPFEDPVARGARGLMAAATGMGAALRAGQDETLRLDVLLAGDFLTQAEQTSSFLSAAWQDLALSDLGHLLGLHTPARPAQVTTNPLGLSLAVQLDGIAFVEGLAAATVDDVRQIMR